MHLTLSLSGSLRQPVAAIQAMARTAERATLDAILLGLPEAGGAMRLDPLPLLGSLIGVTSRIGLGARWSVDFAEPFHVARVFATLDHLSYGRTAWIVGMFDAGALEQRIGRSGGMDDLPAYRERADEFIDVVRKLLDSWEDEGFALDKASGMFADPDRVHPIHHVGRYFSVRGPLNVPRPPQGLPVLMMSEAARRFVPGTADIVLTECGSLAEARARYQALRPARVLVNLSYTFGETAVFSPEQMVDMFAEWADACDGFNLLPARLPEDVDLLADAVIPLARRRGLFRTAYEGTTLREHFGLARPVSQYAAERI